MKRVVLIHGWQGRPGNHWKAWFKSKLEEKGIAVVEPSMPNHSNKPGDWISALAEAVGTPDPDTVLVGHSLGCPTIIGYLMRLKEGEKIAGAVLVAGFSSKLPDYPPLDLFDFDSEEVKKAKDHCNKFVNIVSDNDTDVPMDKSRELNDLVNGELILEHNKGHFCEEDGVIELPSAPNAVFRILSIE